METALIHPAAAIVLGIPGAVWSVLILVIGLSLFSYFMIMRLNPLFKATADPRLGRIPDRLFKFLRFGIFQYRQPRYRLAGILHILIFAGFVILSLRSISLILLGIVDGVALPGHWGSLGRIYAPLKDVAATVVLVVCFLAVIRRGFFRPKRYAVPEKYGKGHTGEALVVLMLISGLMLCDMTFEAGLASAGIQKGFPDGPLFPATGAWLAARMFNRVSIPTLQNIHLTAYFVHDILFFSFLCFLPWGKHFHVLTGLPNIFFMKLDKGSIKPIQWGIDESGIVGLEGVGAKKLEDFTWKHILDFYSCADCGRCSDMCPANAVGRPLSPRFLSLKCRDHAFKKYPMSGPGRAAETTLIGRILEEDEIWSCTTCGACEEECPLMIEYIDKIVDLRRGLVDEGSVPGPFKNRCPLSKKGGIPMEKWRKKGPTGLMFCRILLR